MKLFWVILSSIVLISCGSIPQHNGITGNILSGSADYNGSLPLYTGENPWYEKYDHTPCWRSDTLCHDFEILNDDNDFFAEILYITKEANGKLFDDRIQQFCSVGEAKNVFVGDEKGLSAVATFKRDVSGLSFSQCFYNPFKLWVLLVNTIDTKESEISQLDEMLSFAKNLKSKLSFRY